LRFILTYTPEKQDSSYAQLIVDVDDSTRIPALSAQIERDFEELLPDALVYGFPFELGPGANGKIRARFSGPDPAILRDLANEAMDIFHADPNAKAIRTDWRQRVKVVQPVLAEKQANSNGITRTDVAKTMLQAFQGASVGVYRASMQNLQIWSPAAQGMIPLRQVVSHFETRFEDEIIMRRDRKPTITVFGDPKSGPASVLFSRLRPQIEAIELPADYFLEWGGEYEDTAKARDPLMASLPIFMLIMVLITIALFNSLKEPLIIWLCVPLALIGVTAGLLITRQPFGFMALLGFLSLMGMLIKNAVVLIDEIRLQRSETDNLLTAILNSGTSRLRPVAMAALTTALGMIPLLLDAFFVAMAVTIIFGLMFATVLTMVIVPVLYAIFYGASSDSAESAPPTN